LAAKGVTRRQFLKYAGATAAMLGLSEAMVPELAKVLAATVEEGKPAVIWIQGQNCTGCSISFLNSNYPMVAELVLDKLSVRYHPTVMAGTGDVAMQAIEETVKEMAGKFVLLVEGPVPTAEGGEFCTFGLEKETKDFKAEDGTVYRRRKDKPMIAWMEELVPKAAAVVAIGNCAAFGGIPAANASVTGTKPVQEVVAGIDKNKAVVNVGGCPPHPDWIVGTAMEALLFLKGAGKLDLDQHKRSRTFFGKLIHENCERRAAFDAGLFLEDWNDYNPDMKLCLFKLGCRGPVTYADCPIRRWNSGVNWCVGNNAPCHGCAEPSFYKDLAPLYEPLPNMNFSGISPVTDTLGWVAAGAAAVGIGAHYLYKQLGGKKEGGEA
jgi:hydrogenase small subunit